MPYLVASILAVSSAMIIMLTRYEADDSTIQSELQRVESMFNLIDGFVNVYIDSGESVNSVDFEELDTDDILYDSISTSPNPSTGSERDTKILFQNSDISWQLIPAGDVSNGASLNPTIAFDESSYILLMDFRNESALMSKNRFSESFIGREYCENNLFGTFRDDFVSYNKTSTQIDDTGTNSDGLLACIVYK